MREFLTLSHISKSFGGVQALKDVGLSIGPGKICWLAGENGSGKSTLVKIIAGVHAPDSGEITIHGTTCPRLHPIDAIRHGIQVIYQDLSLFPNLTVAENIAVNYEIAKKRVWVRWREVRAVATRALNSLGVDIDPDALVENLAVAEKEVVAIARALLHDARLIIMDEPTAALTRREVASLFSVVRNLVNEGIAVLVISHKPDEMIEVADRIVILRDGAKVADCDAAALGTSGIFKAIAGRDAAAPARDKPARPRDSEALLKVEGLTKAACFSDVSFELRAGEILGITGLLGSGRTELALSLFGMLPPDSGIVRVGGRLVDLRSVRVARASGIAYVPEDRLTEGLFLRQSIGNNVVAAVVDDMRPRGLLLDKRRIREVIGEWVDRLGIRAPSADFPAYTLSGGNQQRLVLARWLATSPRILILNGPTAGVDVGAKAGIHAILRELADRGMGLLVISDDLSEVAHLCDRAMVMKKGRIAAQLDHSRLSVDDLDEAIRVVPE